MDRGTRTKNLDGCNMKRHAEIPARTSFGGREILMERARGQATAEREGRDYPTP